MTKPGKVRDLAQIRSSRTLRVLVNQSRNSSGEVQGQAIGVEYHRLRAFELRHTDKLCKPFVHRINRQAGRPQTVAFGKGGDGRLMGNAAQQEAVGWVFAGQQGQGVASSLTVLMTPCDAEYMTWLITNASMRYTLRSDRDYGSSPTGPDPSCPVGTNLGRVGPAEVDARFAFTRG